MGHASTAVLQYLLLLWGLSLAGLCAASDPAVEKLASPDLEERLCEHGTYNERNLSCDCDDGWKHAGITDTLNYVKGVCTQFSCTSSEECQERLGIAGAKCDIKGWDCYCGWSWAFKGPSISFGLSPGYQTWGKHGAACQGPLFTLSFWMTGYTLWALASFWKAIFFCTVACLPLGSTKVRCQCYDPGMFRLVLALSGYTSTCDGQCTVERRSWGMLYYDLAWSIYVIDVGIWIYAFLLLAWVTFLVAWGIVIWLMVFVALLVAAVMACSGGGEVSAEHLPDCSGDGCCLGLTNCCQGFGQTGAVPDSVFFYAGGPSPTTDWGCDPCGSCYALGRCWLCAPLAYIFLHFPRRPANMWGGVVGYALLGTHPESRRPYTGGNRIVDFLGFRSDHDLHANEDWRVRVAEFLQVRQQAPQQQEMGTVDVAPQPPQDISSSSIPVRSSSFKVEGRRVTLVQEPFDRDRDNCRNSSYEDYAKRECWICCDSKESPEWDLWLQCGHLFCKRCSTEMLRRKLPCPLCRQVSWHVKRGPAAYAPPSVSSP